MKIRNILYVLVALLALWVLLIAGVYLFQDRIIFQADPLTRDYTFQFDFPFEEHFLKTADGVSLNALYFPTQENRRGAVLYFHGNADNLQRWGECSRDLTERGYDVLMIDYRGYGKSEGQPGEEVCYQDARLAYDWLRQHFSAEEIVLYGRSLGSSIASQLAARVPAKLLVLETPFDNLQHSLQTTVPILWLPWPLKHQFANDRYLPKIKYPIYIFHGTSDLVVPYASAEKLKPLLKKPTRFFTIRGGRHKNLGEFAIFQEKMDDILGERQ